MTFVRDSFALTACVTHAAVADIMKKSKKIAFCAILAALSAIFIILGKFIPIGTYAFPAIAGMFCAIIVIEIGVKWALAAYFVATALSFIFGLNEAVLLFAFFFGYYPIIKSVIEKIKSRIFEYILKLLIFNLSMICAYAVLISVFGLGELGFESMTFVWITLAIGNVVFILYDIGLTRLITLYFIRYHKHISKLIK